MFKFLTLAVLVFGCNAVPYGSGSYSSGGSYAAPKVATVSAGYGSGAGLGFSAGSSGSLVSSGAGLSSGASLSSASAWAPNNNFGLLSVQQGQSFEPTIIGAVQQIARTVEYKPVPYADQPVQAQVVEIEPSDNPVHLHFKSRSSSLSLSQSHTPAAPLETQVAQAQDEPSRLITEVQKPVIQEVREVIHPYRQVTQEINPVVESLHTIVTKGEGQRAQYSGAVGAQYQSQSTQYAARPVAVAAGYGQQAAYKQTFAAPAYKPLAFNTRASGY